MNMAYYQELGVIMIVILYLASLLNLYKHLNISVTLSSGYHHSRNPAEHAVKTVKFINEKVSRC